MDTLTLTFGFLLLFALGMGLIAWREARRHR
jgi:hypothetical protein